MRVALLFLLQRAHGMLVNTFKVAINTPKRKKSEIKKIRERQKKVQFKL